jgi:hypothetical protein
LRVNDTFTGTNARAYNGSNPIPLGGGTHILDGYEFGSTGETAMDPSITSGTRKLPTVLDIAILDDIGYTVNYNAASQNLSSNSVSAASVTYGRCGCPSCVASVNSMNMVGSSNLMEVMEIS